MSKSLFKEMNDGNRIGQLCYTLELIDSMHVGLIAFEYAFVQE
jgi:hypothetical protein